MQTQSIFLVDDDRYVRSAYLRHLGTRDVTEATSVNEALMLLANGYRPSVAIVDLCLGDNSGLIILATLQRLAPRARRILMTAAPERVPAVAYEISDEVVDKLSARLPSLLVELQNELQNELR